MSASTHRNISAGAAATPVSPTAYTPGLAPPELVISAAAINSEPVELDATPVSPSQMNLARRGSKAVALDAFAAEKSARSAGDDGESEQRRAQLISDRQANPAVLVDIPQTPRPEEFERSGASTASDAA